MTRTLALLVASTLGAGGPDAGAPMDAGVRAVARWTAYQGDAVADAGATDLVEVSVGAMVEVPVPQPVVMTVCDAPLAQVETRAEGTRFTGLRPGATHCGLWFFKAAFPQRYVELRVVR
jgi:hypothetical protein